MDDISKKYLVVSTHKGLYKYNRLAFGIKTASEIFQKTMESFFSGIRDVYIYFYDILIASEDLESHLDILKRTLNILKENNFTINKNKCLFVKNEIEYLGHKINEFGIYPLKDKLACIKNCPVPKNITELKSFLGFLSFYSKFLPNLSDLAHPLYNLLKKNVKWSWNAGTDRSFNSCKNALDETTCLSHYSLNLPLILSCDASQVGIGATLSHLKDGEERPVCFISRTLNVHERKYSQVEREGLAIVFAVNKLKNYLFGRKFTIYTDHKPLITIFGDKTNLPPLIANRLHRWALTLSNYSFEIKYKKGKDNIIPDFLSRFPECQEDNLEYNDGSGEILLLNTSIIDHVLVAHETQLDRTLFKLYKIIETGESPSSPNDDLIPYLKRIDDFTILQECIFLENRMVIPKSLHERVLQLLHESHAGTNKMKMMARSSIWWPGMDSSIEIITKNCRTCLSNESLPPQRTETVDSFSSWVEVSEVPSTSAYFCINFMRNCIARYGFPQVVVSDNGPPFFSSDFGDFLSKNGISHVTSPPYHPQSNRQAEVSVREVKKLLKKQLYENEQVELNLALSRALFFIRTDVNIRKGTSPAELFLGRKIRSRLSVLSKEEVKASKFNSQYVNRIQIVITIAGSSVNSEEHPWFGAENHLWNKSEMVTLHSGAYLVLPQNSAKKNLLLHFDESLSCTHKYTFADLLNQPDFFDVATFFDAALEHTRVAIIGIRVYPRRLERILLPSGFCDRVTLYQTIGYAYSDHRAVLIQVGDPTRLLCIGKLLRSQSNDERKNEKCPGMGIEPTVFRLPGRCHVL
ncbi:K02A2.6-like [Cordylochernes scorpioides]|uniref:RNA-directed DNA polymerase n=1 Tax=Cordylochernes scorpioides TaxID=51811 RepID=A0ABY6LC24_9ARAC|nr:K02A2.6-like [Cordylochernes scorpioides]